MRLRPLRLRGRFLTALPLALTTGLSALAGAGCGGDRYIVVGTARAPSACGFVELDGKSEKSTRLTIHLEQLHPVDSLDPALHAYVVWFENGKDTPVRAGSLKYRPDERVGELKAEAPYRKFVVKVTAEANDTPSAPSAFVVADEQISTLD